MTEMNGTPSSLNLANAALVLAIASARKRFLHARARRRRSHTLGDSLAQRRLGAGTKRAPHYATHGHHPWKLKLEALADDGITL